MKIKLANRIASDGTPRFAASHLGLFCLTMSHKKDARLIYGLTFGLNVLCYKSVIGLATRNLFRIKL